MPGEGEGILALEMRVNERTGRERDAHRKGPEAPVEEKVKENRAVWSLHTVFLQRLLWKSGQQDGIP